MAENTVFEDLEKAVVAIEQPVTPESASRATEQVAEQATEQVAEQVAEQVTEQVAEQATEQATEQVVEQAPEYLEGVTAQDWATVPEAVRVAINNNMLGVAEYVREAQPKVEVFNALDSILQPHMAAIQEARTSPLAVISGTLQLAQSLWTGTPEQKAATVASLITGYQVDLNILERVLIDNIKAQQDPSVAAINRLLQPLQQKIEALSSRIPVEQLAVAPSADQQVATEVANFAKATDASGQLRHPHYQKVRVDMGDLFTIAARRQQPLTLEQAYEKACAMNGLSSTSNSTRTRAPVGLSVKNSTSTPTPSTQKKESGSVRDALDQALNLLST